jgi:hypothetical protein
MPICRRVSNVGWRLKPPERHGIAFLHQTSRCCGTANYRDVVVLKALAAAGVRKSRRPDSWMIWNEGEQFRCRLRIFGNDLLVPFEFDPDGGEGEQGTCLFGGKPTHVLFGLRILLRSVIGGPMHPGQPNALRSARRDAPMLRDVASHPRARSPRPLSALRCRPRSGSQCDGRAAARPESSRSAPA